MRSCRMIVLPVEMDNGGVAAAQNMRLMDRPEYDHSPRGPVGTMATAFIDSRSARRTRRPGIGVPSESMNLPEITPLPDRSPAVATNDPSVLILNFHPKHLSG